MKRKNDVVTYNSQNLFWEGKSWFPVMGEFHYSRYRADFWEESLRKMKAGGIGIVATYVIWIHHEEREGEFDFSGCRDLGRFLSACRKVGIQVFLRLGPWVHGEVRNGGFPDWLLRKETEGVALRANDERYLEYVERFWKKVFEQVKGSLYEEGGPVIGIQIENEYGHVGGLKGEEGNAHIRKLTELAKTIGFRVPVWTATGWGGACIGDLLPVMGGYCEAPWAQTTEELPPNANYVFSRERNDALIAADHHTGEETSFDESRFPYLTAELGGGLQVTAHRRPVATGADLGAMTLTKLGSGISLLGYYMFHGGSNPKGKDSTLQESRATGYLNDLPEINYDFHAPIGQYGTMSDSFSEAKKIAYFLQDFGDDLAVLPAEMEPDRVMPWDVSTLRTACRHDDDHGYVFFNNYQRRRRMEEHLQVQLKGKWKGGEVLFPRRDIRDGEYGFYPYRMRLGNAVLTSALATPLCRLRTEKGVVFVFYGDEDPKFCWETEEKADILMLSGAEAKEAWKVSLDQDYLILSPDFVWEEDGNVCVSGGRETRIRCYPKLKDAFCGFAFCGMEGEFAVYERHIFAENPMITVKEIPEKAGSRYYRIYVSYEKKPDRRKGEDFLLSLAFVGNKMEIFLEEEKCNDYFFTGEAVLFDLGYFDFPEELLVKITPLFEDSPVFLETWPEFEQGAACRLDDVQVEYRFR